jgi:hypothetical protein
MKTIFKQYAFPLIGLIVLLTALPVSIWQISKVANVGAEASSFTLIPYPGLSWSEPKQYTVSFLRNPQSSEETIVSSTGAMVTAISDKNISSESYFFYNQLLTSKGYSLLKITGDPNADTTWAATYESEGNICQIQYYPTPYSKDTFTLLLFFGNV